MSYKTGLECSISSLQKKSPLGQLSPKILEKSQWLKNYQKVSFQNCERSEQRATFTFWTDKSSLKITKTGQTVLPDSSVLKGQK